MNNISFNSGKNFDTKKFNNLKAIVLEKPIAEDIDEALKMLRDYILYLF